MTNPTIHVHHERLQAFVTAVYQHAGMPAADAALIAASLVQADLWNHQSHGVLRTAWYYERLQSGVAKAHTPIQVLRDKGAVLVVDAKEAVGQVVAQQVMQMAIAKAKQHGVASVTVRNSNHLGTLMYFTRSAAQAGCIAFLTCNGGPAMAPWGGAIRKLIGTNPWSIAAPAATRPPIMLDMANTGVARGKIYLARQRGEEIPLGWALDAQGAPTTDPQAAIDGMILPMAHHKGYAIATLMDVLAGVLSGSQFLDAVNSPYYFDKPSGTGFFLSVYDIDAFMDITEYNERIERFVSTIKSHPKAQGVEEIFLPGEMEARADELHQRMGIHLPLDTWKDLLSLAQKMNLQEALEAARY